MNAIRYVATVICLVGLTCTVTLAGAQELDARALVRKIETQYQGESSHSMVTMKIVTDAWTRELSMESWSEGRDNFLARIVSPKKEEGTGTLKIGDEMWNYLPKIDRLIKIPSSLMGDSWMGSHLTNDDLVKENKVDDLYDLSIDMREGDRVTVLGIPKPDAAVVWDKIEYVVDLAKMVPVKVLYYDEDGELVRTMSFGDVQEVSGRWLPLEMVIQPEDKPDEKTVLTYSDLTFNIDLPGETFSIRSLRRR